MVGRICVRVDDFPETKGEPQHTLAAYHEFHTRLSGLIGGKRYLLGVIPGRCDYSHHMYLEETPGIEVGMHGVDHDESKLDLWQNEFPPHSTREGIKVILQQNRMMLEQATNRPVTVYMPPRNRIDHRTVDVLSKTGFHGYTTGPETAEEFRTGAHPAVWVALKSGIMEAHTVRYIHSNSPHEYGRSDEMYQRMSQDYLKARCLAGMNTVLTLHWTWETNIGLDHLDIFLSSIGSDFFTDFHY